MSKEKTEYQFKKEYLVKIKKLSPGQSQSWYDYQAHENWKNYRRKLYLEKAKIDVVNGMTGVQYRLKYYTNPSYDEDDFLMLKNFTAK